MRKKNKGVFCFFVDEDVDKAASERERSGASMNSTGFGGGRVRLSSDVD